MTRRFYIFLILLHLAIALPLAYCLNIWVDEGSTLHTTEHGFFQTFHDALANEKQAPLYFWLVSLWREINGSIFFARFFSIVCSIVAIKFFADLARKIFRDKAAMWATAFFALHPFLVWASLEIRVYSLVVLLSVLLLSFFNDGYFESENERRGKKRIGYALLSIIALYTNYYLGFTLVGGFLALLVSRKFQAAKSYSWQMCVVGACFVPLIWTMKSQFSVNTNEFQPEKSLGEGLRILWNFSLTFVLPTEIMPPENSTTAISVLRLWLVRLALTAAIIFFVVNRRKLSDKLAAFGTIAATNALFLLLAYFLLGAIYVEIRHAAVLFAPLILFGGLLVREIFGETLVGGAKKFSAAIGAIAAIILTVFFAYSIYALYPNLTKRGDWARVGEYIEQNERPDQPLVVFTAFDAPTLPYYYHGMNRILPDENFFEWGLEDEIGSANSWRRQTEFIISEIPPESREIWLLTNEKCRTGQSCEPLENFVRANYTVIEEKDFYKEKVRLLRKKTNE